MKKYIILFLLITSFFSCTKNEKSKNDIQSFIDVDVNAEYRNYFDNLSVEYKDILKKHYKNSNLEVVYDSVVLNRKDINDSILAGKFSVKNYVIETHQSLSNKNIKIIKYRTLFYDITHKSDILKEKIVVETFFNNEKKYIPYNPKLIPEIDSLLSNKYSSNLLSEIQKCLNYKEKIINDVNYNKIKKRFDEYFFHFNSNNIKIFEYIYPPLIEELLRKNNQKKFSQEQKLELAKMFTEKRNLQELKFKRFLIDDFHEINCLNEKKAYVINYLVDVDNNSYIPCKLIAIILKNEVYFIEPDIEELKSYYANILPENFINCLEKTIYK